MAAPVLQLVGGIGYVVNNANNFQTASQALRTYVAGQDRFRTADQIVLQAGGGQGVSPVSARRGPSITPDRKRVKFSSRISPALRSRLRSRLGVQNRRRRTPYYFGLRHRFVVSGRGYRPKFIRTYI